MTARFSAACLLLLLSACTTALRSNSTQSAPLSEGGCAEAQVQSLIGQSMNERTGKLALAKSGALHLRWIRADDGITMDYQSARLNIATDSAGIIRRVFCG